MFLDVMTGSAVKAEASHSVVNTSNVVVNLVEKLISRQTSRGP